ncbi:MAG: ArsR/SmtB family transcription factor [Pseudodesulfovibrio sp.]|uniref:ArsR/SmtB family transcription factor n=1 Tax=Pseudodesulfovibrio sp. TaxID=2035812 RepID=UPI003D12EAE7
METLAEQLKAFSDPTRLRIVRLLEHGELCVCDLMEALDLPQSKVSRHMSFLKSAGWVLSRRNGKWIYYSLAEPDSPIQADVLAALRQGLPQVPQAMEDYQRLCHYLETKNPEKCD